MSAREAYQGLPIRSYRSNKWTSNDASESRPLPRAVEEAAQYEDDQTIETRATLASLMNALEHVHPTLRHHLTAQQHKFLVKAEADKRRTRVRGEVPVVQRVSDFARSRPLRPVDKSPCHMARGPALWREEKGRIPVKQAAGVSVGPPTGDRGGPTSSVLACPRDFLAADADRAWAGQLRSVSWSTAHVSTRYSPFAADRGTALGARADPDKIGPGRRKDVENTYNRYRLADFPEPKPGFEPGPSIPRAELSGPAQEGGSVTWYVG